MEKNNRSIQLDRPRVLLPKASQLRKWCFYALVLALGGLGGWASVITAFEIKVYPTVLVALGLFCCGFHVWRQVDARKRWWSVSLLGWLVWLAVLVFRFDSVAHGAYRVVNLMLDCYSAKLNYDLPVFTLPYTGYAARPNPVGECTNFFSILQYPFFWAMSRLWVRERNSLGPFALTGLLLLLPMSFSIVPAEWAFGALLLFWCALLLIAPALGGRDGLLGHGKRYRVSGAIPARPGTLLLIPAIALCMLCVYRLAPPEDYKRPQVVDGLRAGLRDAFSSSPYLRGGQGNNNKQVQLNALGSRSYTGETMLRVRFDWERGSRNTMRDNLIKSFAVDGSGGQLSVKGDSYRIPAANSFKEYLKSFVGSVYTGETWERLPVEARQELEDIELTAQNQIARYHEEMFLNGRDEDQSYRLSVENVGANPRCVYVPASLSSTPERLSAYQLELVDDGYVKSSSFLSGTREYRLGGVAHTYGSNYFSRVAGVILRREYNHRYFTNSLGASNIGWIHEDPYDLHGSIGAAEFENFPIFSSMLGTLNTQAEEGGPGWPEDLWKAQLAAGPYLTDEEIALTTAVEDYNAFVYRHYTQVPEELDGFLENFREALGLIPYGRLDMEGDFRYKDGAEAFAYQLAEMFRTYYTYTLNPPSPGPGQDFVEFFLDQSHEGFCVHFATAAVLLLRSAGYPARYAEGYVVPSEQDGQWVDVPDYNAHAWVEVYCGGTGWIPVEVTPPSTDNPAVYYNAILPEEENIPTPVPVEEMPTLPPRRTPSPQETPDASQGPAATPSTTPTPAPLGGVSGSGGDDSFWPVMLACAGALAAVCGLLVLSRALLWRKRRKDFAQKNRSQAALKAYAYLLKLYHWEALCGQREEQPPRWKELAEKARFARDMLSQEELEELTGDAERLAAKLREQLPRFQKLKCWLAGLI